MNTLNMKPVRCPCCKALMAEHLDGYAMFTCRKCGEPFIVDRTLDKKKVVVVE